MTYKSKKANIDNNVLIGDNVKLYGNVTIEKNVIIEDNVIIGYPNYVEINSKDIARKGNLNEFYDSVSSKNTIIKEGSIVKSGSRIYSNVILGTNVDCGQFTIVRSGTEIKNSTFIYPHTLIGMDVIIGEFCRIAGTLCNRTQIGNYSKMLGHTIHQYKEPIQGIIEPSPIIGNAVIVGRESIVVGGVNMEDYSLLTTNSTLTKSISIGAIVSGNPARLVRYRLASEITEIKNKLNL